MKKKQKKVVKYEDYEVVECVSLLAKYFKINVEKMAQIVSLANLIENKK